MGVHRDRQVRFLPGRVEFRGEHELDGPDYTNLLRLGAVGMLHGLSDSTPEEQARIYTATVLRVKKPEDYLKERDLYIVRALESCAFNADGELDLISDQGNAQAALEALAGRELHDVSYNFYRQFFTRVLTLDEKGCMQADPTRLQKLLRSTAGSNGPRGVKVDEIDHINAKLQQFTVQPTETVVHTTYSGNAEDVANRFKKARVFPAIKPTEYRELAAVLGW
jgi:hypothetical protein